eukprot:gene16682-19818_t
MLRGLLAIAIPQNAPVADPEVKRQMDFWSEIELPETTLAPELPVAEAQSAAIPKEKAITAEARAQSSEPDVVVTGSDNKSVEVPVDLLAQLRAAADESEQKLMGGGM